MCRRRAGVLNREKEIMKESEEERKGVSDQVCVVREEEAERCV